MSSYDEELKRLVGEKRFSLLTRHERESAIIERPVPEEELIPDKNYDKLSVRLSFKLKEEFERICRVKQRRPSEQARMLIEDFVKKEHSEEAKD